MPKPNFSHENKAIHNFVNMCLDDKLSSNSNLETAQFIIMSGIALENSDLIDYACKLDPTCPTKFVETHIITIFNSIFGPAIDVTF